MRRVALRASIIAALALLAPSALAQAPAQVDAYPVPDRPIRLVVPFSPGASLDFVARIVGQALAERLRHAVVVENRPGAGGNLGAESVARAAADGHTILFGGTGFMVINPFMGSGTRYDPVKDFAPISLVATAPLLLVARPQFPAGDVRELVAYARARPSKLSLAAAGGSPYLGALMFSAQAGIEVLQVPYFKGGPAATADLLAGAVDIELELAPALIGLIRGGKLKALGVSSARRMKALPEVPTIAEGGVADFELVTWQGLLAPAATAPEIVARLQRETAAVLSLADVRTKLEASGYEIVASTAAEFQRWIGRDLEKYRVLAPAADPEKAGR